MNFHTMGNKGSNQMLSRIVNLIPKHKRYFELFARTAAVYKYIYNGQESLINDIDAAVYKHLTTTAGTNTTVTCMNALQLLSSMLPGRVDDFFYLDPPYPLTSRRSHVGLYKYEMSDEDHVQLLSSILEMKSMVLISTYENDLYNEYLSDWNKRIFKTNVFGKTSYEVVFYNYKDPVDLHNYNLLGKDRTDRQRIKRKCENWLRMLDEMPVLERRKILQLINKKYFNEK